LAEGSAVREQVAGFSCHVEIVMHHLVYEHFVEGLLVPGHVGCEAHGSHPTPVPAFPAENLSHVE